MTTHFAQSQFQYVLDLPGSYNAARKQGLIAKIFGSIGTFFDIIERAQTATATYNHLSNMSDDELAQQGLSRDDVPQAVYKRVFGDS